MKLKSKELFKENVLFMIRAYASASEMGMHDEHADDEKMRFAADLISNAMFYVLHTYRTESGFSFRADDPVFAEAAIIVEEAMKKIYDELGELNGLPLTITMGKKELIIMEAGEKLADELYELYSKGELVEKTK